MMIADEFATVIAERLAHETEAWCAAAIRQGPEWRVWRSEPIFDSGDRFTITHKFKMLALGEGSPGAGQIFGPWPERPRP